MNKNGKSIIWMQFVQKDGKVIIASVIYRKASTTVNKYYLEAYIREKDGETLYFDEVKSREHFFTLLNEIAPQDVWS